MKGKIGNLPSRIVSGGIAEIIMILGYYVFEGFMYGFVSSAVNIPANAVQGIAGLILGCVLIKIFEKNKILMKWQELLSAECYFMKPDKQRPHTAFH